jgi:superfamily II DNA or RNA helicase
MIITCSINDRIYIPRVKQLEDFYQELSEKFTYFNAQYAKMQSMGYFTGNVDKYIKTWNYVIHPEYGESMSIPRGGIDKLREVASQYNFKLSFKDKRLSCEPITTLYNDLELWPEQKILAKMMFQYQNCLIRSPTGSGKCLAPNTEVIVNYDERKLAKNIKTGDKLLGPDLNERKVLSTTTGRGRLYKVTLDDNSYFICNEDHILVVSDLCNGIEDKPIKDFIDNDNHEYYAVKRIPLDGYHYHSFNVKYIGVGPYVGWTLNGDGRFLLANDIVTHNTELTLKVIEWILKDAGPVLVIVWEGSHKAGLLGQWVKRTCQRFGLTKDQVGIIQGNTKRVRPITIGMQQTLKNVGRKYINEFGGIICDEIQRFAAPTFREVIDIYPAKYRIGISADETRKDKKEFFIYDCFGKVVGEIEKEALVKKHKIHEVDIRLIPSEFNFFVKRGEEELQWNELASEEKNFNDLLDAMIDDEERDEVIWPYVYSCLKTNHTVMLATARVGHAKKWDKKIREAGFTCGLMLGGTKQEDEFQSTVEALCNRNINAGIGTIQKIAQGLDVPTWDRGFVLTPLASNRQRLEQLFGRLRRTAPGKKDAVVYYLFDQHIYPYHLNTLKKLYRRHVYYPQDNGKFTLIN